MGSSKFNSQGGKGGFRAGYPIFACGPMMCRIWAQLINAWPEPVFMDPPTHEEDRIS